MHLNDEFSESVFHSLFSNAHSSYFIQCSVMAGFLHTLLFD